jgi:hypothetical protein
MGEVLCRHPDIQKFDGVRCCLSCGEAVFETFQEPQDCTDTSTYQYGRLNYTLGHEIRLIVLYPGDSLDDVVCDLIHVNLMDKPAYEALLVIMNT